MMPLTHMLRRIRIMYIRLHKQELLDFAAKHHLPLDLSQFEILEWYPSRHYLQINWKSRASPREVITFYSNQPI
jgi:hypothetical protein